MEVNKGEAERCRDMGAEALRNGQYSRAAKLLSKSLQLFPLPGVKALLKQAEKRVNEETNGEGGNHASGSANGGGPSFSSNGRSDSRRRESSSSFASAPPASTNGDDGRPYTQEQAAVVQHILKAKEGGGGAHYRVLGLEQNADDAALKRAYRKLALKLHPDKNSAPHAGEAFKAVGLAYATLSDPQKRSIYDRYGDEDPDNRGGGSGGMRRGAGGVHFNGGQDVNPEDIFNMFFGGGMPGGMGTMPGGFRVYTTGMGRMPRQNAQGGNGQQDVQGGGLKQLAQLLPLILLFLFSFFNFPGETETNATGGSHYFSLTHAPPYVNPLHTRFTNVKDIPYFVSDKFMRTYYRDRYQLSQVERMVEKSYENYLIAECKNQQMFRRQLEKSAKEQRGITESDRERLMKKAAEFELTRCVELNELFPRPAYGRR